MAVLLALLLAAGAPPSSCRPAQLGLATDGRDGDFNGMSHAGTLLVVRNRSTRACTLPGLPRITFEDARGRVLPAVRRPPTGMHPGPVVRPMVLPPGGRAGAGLRWVSGAVFDRSRCLDPARVALALPAGRVRTAIRAHLCGPADAPATFDQPPLTAAPDPADAR